MSAWRTPGRPARPRIGQRLAAAHVVGVLVRPRDADESRLQRGLRQLHDRGHRAMAPPAGAAAKRHSPTGRTAATHGCPISGLQRCRPRTDCPRRIMWFLVHGGALRRVPEFEISTEHVQELRTVLARLELGETSERDVMSQVVPRPDSIRRLAILTADEPWRRLVHDDLLDVVHNFRSLGSTERACRADPTPARSATQTPPYHAGHGPAVASVPVHRRSTGGNRA